MVAVWHRGRQLVMARVWLVIAIGCLRAVPGPLGLVDSGVVPLVPSDHLRCSGIVWLWPLVGRSPVVPCDWRHALLHNAGAFPGCRGSVDGGVCPLDVIVCGIPSHHCVGIGW